MNTYLQDVAFINCQTIMHTLGQFLHQRRQLSGFVQGDVSAAGKPLKADSYIMTVQLTNGA